MEEWSFGVMEDIWKKKVKVFFNLINSDRFCELCQVLVVTCPY